LEDVAAEAADVLITFYVFAASLALNDCLGEQFPDYGPADVYADPCQHLLWLGARYGDLTGACMRYLGRSRRGGTLEDVAEAAAGVLAYVHIFSASLGIDLEAAWRAKAAVIAARPWRESENGDGPALMFPKPPARRYTDAERQMLRDYMCPACRTSTLASGPRGRKHCTECGAEYTIPRRPISR
jgi:NTP pyrophosphatase (non-canonical NTP hydrolase)